ncbi:MAG: YdcH family protein [Maritimibacter sp.]|nr:YdcH family protein [Maritimibacter sp.]
MSALMHEIADDFPELAEKLAAMRETDAGFAEKIAEYETLNKKVIEAETLEKPTHHFREEELKKKRALLKDEIYAVLSA